MALRLLNRATLLPRTLASRPTRSVCSPLKLQYQYKRYICQNWSNDPEEIGTLTKGDNEFILYYSKLWAFNTQRSRTLLKPFYSGSTTTYQKTVEANLPKDVPVTITKMVPRFQEGSAFVRFKLNEGAAMSIEEAENAILSSIRTTRPSTYWRRWHVHRVKGRPFIEDMMNGGTSEIRVSFHGPDVDMENLYAVFRRYGRIVRLEPPSPSTKDIPRSAVIKYLNYNAAAAAKACSNMQIVGETVMHVNFIPNNRLHHLWSWLSSHPRIVLPAFFAITAGLAYSIFEPVRQFSIVTTAKGSWNISEYDVVKSFKGHFQSWNPLKQFLHTDEDDENDAHTYDDTHLGPYSEELSRALKESENTFIVLYGPQGSGKTRIVEQSVKGPHLLIDAYTLNECSNDNEKLAMLSQMIGYFPIFLWTNYFMQFVDLAAQSLAGQKSGFSETVDDSSARMLATASVALRRIALRNKPADADASEYLSSHPEELPVIIIRDDGSKPGGPRSSGYSADGQATSNSNSDINRVLAYWTAALVRSNSARVVYVTRDQGFNQTLSEALPNQVFKTIAVCDSNITAAKNYSMEYLKRRIERSAKSNSDCDPQEVLDRLSELPESLLQPFGGRLSDLQMFSRRILAGEDPEEAVKNMIDFAAAEILQIFLSARNKESWSAEHVWSFVKQLAKADYDEYVPISFSFTSKAASKDDLNTIILLEQRRLINIQTIAGEIVGFRASKPLYQEAFKELVNDPFIYAQMETRLLKMQLGQQEKKIAKLEDEIKILSPQEAHKFIQRRLVYLGTKFAAAQAKIEEYEQQINAMQKQCEKSARSTKFK